MQYVIDRMKSTNTYIKKTGLLFLGLFILASCSSDDDSIDAPSSGLSDMEILIAIDDANPTNVLGWDTEEEDLSKWNGVTVANGRVTSLSIAEKGIEQLPEAIGGLTELDTLNVGSNALTALPASIGELTGLYELSLYNNQISELPDEMAGLKANLEVLNLSRNQLEGYPEVISGLTALKYLSLSNNVMAELPASIEGLVNLEEFNLFRTGLVTLLEEIGALVSLKRLDVSGNDNTLESLPEVLADLENLERIDVPAQGDVFIPEALKERDKNDPDFSIYYWW